MEDYIQYKNKVLCIDGTPYTQFISKKTSPSVCVSLDRIKSNIALLRRGLCGIDHNIHYALKASYLKPIVETVRKEGLGVEIMSEYEWKLALKGKFSKTMIVMNGLGRSAEELMTAIKNKSIVNIDSLSEVKKLSSYKKFFQENRSTIGLRIHPDFSGDGNFVKKGDKLGMSYSEAKECIVYAKKIGLRITGFSFHIFSNQTNSDIYEEIIGSLKDFVTGITNEYELDCKYIDIGGGIAPRIIFTNDKESEYFFTRISSIFRKYFSSEVRLIIEPGRYLVSDAVIVLARIKTIKYMGGKTWAVLDIGTNYLIPAPGCNYKVIPCVESETFSKKTTNVMFVDGICSPAGHIGESNMDVKEGQVVAVLNCGAYTSVMKEEFVFCTPRHVYIESGKVVKVVKKKTFAEFAKFHGW